MASMIEYVASLPFPILGSYMDAWILYRYSSHLNVETTFFSTLCFYFTALKQYNHIDES